MLYSKRNNMKIPRGAVATGDNFDQARLVSYATDRGASENVDFYAPERMGVPLPSTFSGIEDDYSNRQNIVMPRFRSDMMDDDRHLIDVFNNNEDRLKALDDYIDNKPRHLSARVKGRVDFDKVDRIIDALDSFKDKYFDDKQALKA